MDKVFALKLDRIQPSQLYINKSKLDFVRQWFEDGYNPVPVKRVGDDIVLTDGHTRTTVAYLLGKTEINVCWDEDDLDCDAYQICVDWCKEEGITTIAALAERIVTEDDYDKLWLKRCRRLHEQLDQKRKGHG